MYINNCSEAFDIEVSIKSGFVDIFSANKGLGVKVYDHFGLQGRIEKALNIKNDNK